MEMIKKSVVSSLFGSKGHISVSRGVAEFRGRRPVLITVGCDALLALPVEGLDEQRLAEFIVLCAPVGPRLVITARRALAPVLGVTGPAALPLAPGTCVETVRA